MSADIPRRRRNDRSEIPVSFLPEGNRSARWAYVFALLGLIPPFGAIFGLPAFVLGAIGLRIARRDPERRGVGHAYLSRFLGMVELLCGVAGVACFGKALGWF